MHLAIRWNLARPGITSVVVGARNRAQAEANVGGARRRDPGSGPRADDRDQRRDRPARAQ